jgi:hypothetical protein
MHSILIVGAALVGLPIILHLIMKQEPKRLAFPAFRFLRQKLKTNQRKLRLRHFILLAIRMLLIALFAATLFQPLLSCTSHLGPGINLGGEQPVAVVIIIDTTPSMGYTPADKSRLDEAKRRALELLDSLSDRSRVAVIDTADMSGDWLPSVSDARRRINEIKEPKGTGQPITSALGTAYQLLRTVDQETESSEPLPRLIAVFTDRAAACWDPSRVEDLKKLRDGVPEPKPAHAIVDVGTDQPANVAILSVEMKPQVISSSQPAIITVTLAAAGPDVDAVVKAQLDDSDNWVRKPAPVPGGQTRALLFEFKDLKPGLHQLRFELETKDSLLFDNVRFLTFRVAEARKVLTIADDPAEAAFWKIAVESNASFDCDLVKTADAPADLAKYEVVCLFAVGHPAPLWERLRKYVEAGGKLVIIPGDKERMALDEYNGEAANPLMPGTLKDVFHATEVLEKDPKRKAGVPWALFTDDEQAMQHPMLVPFRAWKQKGNVDLFRLPRKAWRYWEVDKGPQGSVIVSYDDSDDRGMRHPALLDRGIIDAKDKTIRGRVILLTTKMEVPGNQDWNDYWEGDTSWPVVFPDLLLRYAAGSTEDANFNFVTGQTVSIPLAKLLAGKRGNLGIDGPPGAIVGNDAVVMPAERQTELKLSPPRTNSPGNYVVTGTNPEWKEGFSLNVPAEESTLDKVPVEAIEDLTGPGSVIPVGKDLNLRDAIATTEGFKTPIDLFPWLLFAVLMLLVLEGFVANRFYRRPAAK